MSSRKNKIERRPSIHDQKSLSTTPSSYLQRNEKSTSGNVNYNSSDDENQFSDEDSFEYQPESATCTDTTSDRSHVPHERSSLSPKRLTDETRRPNSWHQQKSSPSIGQSSSISNIYLFLFLFGTIVVLILTFFNSNIFGIENKIQKCSFEKFDNIQPLQPERVWQTISTGINLIINKQDRSPGVYLFIHKGSYEIKKLILSIAEHASKCFGHTMHPVQMESSDFTSIDAIEDYGYAIEKFKTKIKKGNVILILNLNGIPAEAARALHAICDTHSPIAEDIVIFLTLTIDKNATIANPAQLATDTLVQLWGSKLNPHELDPLITRVTDQVVLLRS